MILTPNTLACSQVQRCHCTAADGCLTNQLELASMTVPPQEGSDPRLPGHLAARTARLARPNSKASPLGGRLAKDWTLR